MSDQDEFRATEREPMGHFHASAVERILADRAQRDTGLVAAIETLAEELASEADAHSEQMSEFEDGYTVGMNDSAERLRALLSGDHAAALAERDRRIEERWMRQAVMRDGAAIREAQEHAWDAAVEEAHDLGWLHDVALADVQGRNPYRADRLRDARGAR